jgi:hypothetical protein
MRHSRILASSVFVTTIAVAIIASCSSADSGSHHNVDAPAHSGTDAPGSDHVFLDAPASTGGDGIGKACTPGAGSGFEQGDCPVGFTCLSLTGGTHAWCSKMCTSGTGDTCNTGYTSAGHALCYLSITPADGTAAKTFCGAICEDDTPTHQICTAAVCNGTCPSTPSLACTAVLTSGMPAMMVAKGCQ